jgi:hypothetical protein
MCLAVICLPQQYKLKDEQTSSPEFLRIITEAWQNLSPADRQPYENRARADMARCLEEERLYEEKQVEFSMLRKAALEAGGCNVEGAGSCAAGRQCVAGPPAEHAVWKRCPSQQLLPQMIVAPGEEPELLSGAILFSV